MRGHRGSHPTPDYHDFYDSVDHLVMGSGTYEKVLTFDNWPYAGKRVVVLSTTLEKGRDPNVVVAADLGEVLAILRDEGAERVYVDGGQVVQTFLRHQLIDELVVSVAPVLLGSGLPLFGHPDADVRLIHLGSSYSDTGMVTSRHAVGRAGSPQPRQTP